MLKTKAAILASCFALAGASADAFAFGEASEAEAARHQARAGGPTNDRDRELLTRYGCFAPSDNPFCARLAARSAAAADETPPRHRRHAQ